MKPARPTPGTGAGSPNRGESTSFTKSPAKAAPSSSRRSKSSEQPTLEEALARMHEVEGFTPGLDQRPELAVVDPSTRPPTIIARLEVCGQPTRVSRSQKVRTTSEAILSLLAIFVRGLEAPTCVSLLTDDPMIFRLLSTTSPPRGWLRRAADALEAESSSGDVTIVIEPLEPGKIEEPYGYA